jgi:5'(3')-deoxyribonucleotidase
MYYIYNLKELKYMKYVNGIYKQKLTKEDKIKAIELNEYSKQIKTIHNISYRYRNLSKINNLLNLTNKLKGCE